MDFFKMQGVNGNATAYNLIFLVFYRNRTMS